MSLVDNTVTNIGAYEHVIIKLALVPEKTDSNAT